ncbi:MAG TPA: MFS transporter [Candidatus Baltobacteraceae bacterium]|nr:MFS transporter [Candidatus Baltobacteraceae bacterium]
MRAHTATEPGSQERAGLGRNVIALGWVAFFGGLAQDMILPVLPVFYTSVLGLRKEFVGTIEGALTSVVSLAKIGAGYLSDALGRRKAVVFVGYALSALGRLGLGFAGSGGAVFGLRLSDGLGKGLKDAPRDALVAGAAGDRSLGYAFGVQRTLDTLGSVLGPVGAFLFLKLWIGPPSRTYPALFFWAGLVAAIPLLIIGVFVRERKAAVKKQPLSLTVLRGPFAGFLVVMLLFTLGNSSDAFLILRAQGVGVPVALIPIVYAIFNLVSASAAIPAGRLADRVGRRRVIGYGWGVYALAYLGFALATAPWMIWFLYAFYGLFYALTEGSAKALVAELVPDEGRGAAYGLYSAAIGVMALPASVIAGLLWDRVSPAAPFAFGAALAAASVVGLVLLPQPEKLDEK